VPASDWLAAGVIRALETECGTVDEAVLVVLKTPGVGDELHARGVRDLSGFGPAEVYVPPEHERWVYRRVAEHFGYAEDDEGREGGRPSTSKRGRREKAVSDDEAAAAAAIYVADSALYDAKNDGGAYAVHELYTRGRARTADVLSRPMVGHLIRAIKNGWLSWDAANSSLRIPDEFRTSEGRFVIPRRKPDPRAKN
jgi:hypothetical protein